MDVDIGFHSPSVFTGIDQDVAGRRLATFVTGDGDVFSLDHHEIEARIRYLRLHDMEVGEEHKAQEALLKLAS